MALVSNSFLLLLCPFVWKVGNHNYGQLLDFSGLEPDGPEKLDEHKVNLSNYAELKARMAERCGMHVQILRFSETVTQARLIRIIQGTMVST